MQFVKQHFVDALYTYFVDAVFNNNFVDAIYE